MLDFGEPHLRYLEDVPRMENLILLHLKGKCEHPLTLK